jgi:hypothetical protein
VGTNGRLEEEEEEEEDGRLSPTATEMAIKSSEKNGILHLPLVHC